MHANQNDAPAELPKIGDGATIVLWSDRYAATVTAVSPDGRTVTVREDKAIRTDSYGMSETQHYQYEPDPNGRETVFTLRRVRGQSLWVRKGDRPFDGVKLWMGCRRHYYDYSF